MQADLSTFGNGCVGSHLNCHALAPCKLDLDELLRTHKLRHPYHAGKCRPGIVSSKSNVLRTNAERGLSHRLCAWGVLWQRENEVVYLEAYLATMFFDLTLQEIHRRVPDEARYKEIAWPVVYL